MKCEYCDESAERLGLCVTHLKEMGFATNEEMKASAPPPVPKGLVDEKVEEMRRQIEAHYAQEQRDKLKPLPTLYGMCKRLAERAHSMHWGPFEKCNNPGCRITRLVLEANRPDPTLLRLPWELHTDPHPFGVKTPRYQATCCGTTYFNVFDDDRTEREFVHFALNPSCPRRS